MNGSIVIPQAAKFAGREPITIGFSSIAVRVFMRRMPKRPVIQRAHRSGRHLPKVSTK